MDPSETKQNREQRILEAASQLITHYGYDKTTVADIAEEAGISKGAIYLHFESKEKLFEALINHESIRVLDVLLKLMEADPDSGNFSSLYKYGLMALAENPLMRALTTRNKRILGDYVRQMTAAKWSSMSGNLRGFTYEFVEMFQKVGLLRTDLDPKTIVYMLGIIRYGLLMVDDLLPPDDIVPFDEFGPVLTDMIERTLMPAEMGDPVVGKQIIEQWIAGAKRMLESYNSSTPDNE